MTPFKPMNLERLPGKRKQSLKWRWAMLAFALTATILNYIDRLAFNYLSAEGALRKMIPDDAFGFIGTAFFAGYLLSNLVSGFLIDRLGTRIGYSLCMAFWTTASLLQAFATMPFHFGLIRGLLGIGEAGNWPAAIKLTNEWFPPEERSTATGIFNSGAAIGAVITPPLIVWLADAYGWQAAFIILASIGYLWLVIFWFFYYTPERSLRQSKARVVPPLKLIRTRFVCWLTVSKLFMDPIWYFITFWIGRYLVDVHGWGLSKIGWFVMLPFLVADIGNIAGGFFTQWLIKGGMPIPRARKVAVGIFGAIVAISLIAGPFVIVSPASALIVLSMAAFGHAAYTSNTMAFPGDVVPQSATASVWGVASVGAGLGGLIFQSLSGITVKLISGSSGYAMAYNTVFVGYGLLAIIGVSIVLFVMGPLVKNESLYEFVTRDRTTSLMQP